MKSYYNRIKKYINPFSYVKFNFTGSILKNKDQVGESDKSYSGTSSKHVMGSDRVVKDREQKGLTTNVDDSQTHLNVSKPHIKTDIQKEGNIIQDEGAKTTTEEDTKKEFSKQKLKENENKEKIFSRDKQTQF
jgi:hypothetical protein